MTAVHEVTQACAGIHCWIHDVDEPGTGYRACFECGHLYRTEQELVNEYNEGARQVNASPVPPFPVPPDLAHLFPPQPDPGPAREIASGKDAWFCPLCMHDF
jgi:hypothetical protein